VEIGLELEVEIEAHPLFFLDVDGVLRCDMPVNGYAWMAERWVEVPPPDGMQQMRLSRDAFGLPAAGSRLSKFAARPSWRLPCKTDSGFPTG
jgi:hypothetical protein